jgi:SH3-like domain-containing protein
MVNRVIVARAHRSNYPEPVRFRRGDAVGLGETDPEFPGWIRITDPRGRVGWAPEVSLDRQGPHEAIATADYDGTELDVSPGDQLTVERELAGWYWVCNDKGELGWVPIDSTRPLPT